MGLPIFALSECKTELVQVLPSAAKINTVKELTIPTHLSPKGLLGLADTQNKLRSVASGQKNAITRDETKNE